MERSTREDATEPRTVRIARILQIAGDAGEGADSGLQSASTADLLDSHRQLSGQNAIAQWIDDEPKRTVSLRRMLARVSTSSEFQGGRLRKQLKTLLKRRFVFDERLGKMREAFAQNQRTPRQREHRFRITFAERTS